MDEAGFRNLLHFVNEIVEVEIESNYTLTVSLDWQGLSQSELGKWRRLFLQVWRKDRLLAGCSPLGYTPGLWYLPV